jgi:hypothetical protein
MCCGLKCSSGTFPRVEFPGILGFLGSLMCCAGFEVFIRDVSSNRVSRAFLGFWVPNVLYGPRSVHLGRFLESSFPGILGFLGPPACCARFPESSFPGILGLLKSPMCCAGVDVFIRDVSPNRVSRAFLGFWGPRCAVRASKCLSGTFP